MASENAKAVAQEVIETVRKGQKVVLGKIIRKRYSKSVSERPSKVTETKSYQGVIKPLVDQLIDERQAVIEEMRQKRGGAKYRDLTDALDKITKNIQLLNGGETDRTTVVVAGFNYDAPKTDNSSDTETA